LHKTQEKEHINVKAKKRTKVKENGIIASKIELHTSFHQRDSKIFICGRMLIQYHSRSILGFRVNNMKGIPIYFWDYEFLDF